MMDILFVCAEAPTGERPRSHGLIAALVQRGHSVTVVFGDEAGTTFDDLSQHCRKLVPARRRQLAEAVAAELTASSFDVAHLERAAAEFLPAPLPIPTVLDAVTCVSLRRGRAIHTLGPVGRVTHSTGLAGLRRAEAALVARYQRVMMATDVDARALRELVGTTDETQNTIHVVPGPVDLQRFAPPLQLRDPATLLVDLRELDRAEAWATLRLAGAAMALVWDERADARLTILGAVPLGAGGRLIGDPRVVVTGPVHDPRGHLMAASVVIAPLAPATSAPHGAVEAIATAAGLIAGRSLASDLGGMPGYDLLVADTPEEIARAALTLIDDPPYRGQLGRAGRRRLELTHGPMRALAALENVYAAATGSAIAEWRLEVGLDQVRLVE